MIPLITPVDVGKIGNISDILFRCSATRVGKKQKITSPKCAAIFGAAVNDFAGWNFDLTKFNCHLQVYLLGKSIQVRVPMKVAENAH